MKKVILFGLSLLMLSSVIIFTGCSKDNLNDDSFSGKENLKAIATELEKNAAFTNFARLLAKLEIPDGTDNFTVFAVPDSITVHNGAELSATDIGWHVVAGKYTTADMQHTQTLRTIGGQTLHIVNETAEIDGQEQTLTYINGIPLNRIEHLLLEKSIVYPIGSNIAKISATPDTDDMDVYNNWLAMKMEGVWAIKSVEHRRYLVYGYGQSQVEDKSYYRKDMHIGCREILQRDPMHVKQGMTGKYESIHPCGSILSYSPFSLGHGATGWWSVSTSDIGFYRSLFYNPNILNREDSFVFDTETALGQTIIGKSRCGYDLNILGFDDPTLPTSEIFETTYILQKIANK